MKRRGFLKLIGAVGGAIALPVQVLARHEAVTGYDVTMTLNGKSIGAANRQIQISQELLDDCVLDLESYLRGPMGFNAAISYEIEREFLYGISPVAHPPVGILNGIDCDELWDDDDG